jgi:leucyl-tRNA synthetase
MSKSKGNVVDPDEIVERLGADTVRAYLAFIGPYNETNAYPWDPNGVVGVRRFLEKVWRISERVVAKNSDENSVAENSKTETESTNETPEEIKKELHKVIKRVGEEFSQLKFNAGIAQLMTFANIIDKKNISKSDFSDYIKLLSVVAPHISEEIYSKISSKNSGDENNSFVSNAKWPEYDRALIVESTVEIAVQVGGKIREIIKVNIDITEEEITKIALESEIIQKWIGDSEVKKTIYIKGKIFSIVI